VTGAGTGTYPIEAGSGVYTELQPGSYIFMDADYGRNMGTDGTPVHEFQQSLFVLATVMSRALPGRAVVDAGLKSLGMDHGDPSWDRGDVFFCSDEHTTLAPHEFGDWSVGDRVRLYPAHVDPTVAKHEQMWLVDGDTIVDRWPIDLRHW